MAAPGPTNTVADQPVPDLGRFRSVLGVNKEVAEQCRFIVIIKRVTTGGVGQELPFLCSQAELPGRAFNADEVRYYGPTFKLPYQSTYTDFNLTFICRQEMREKEYFDDWMNQINPKSTYDFAYPHDYFAEIDVYQFSNTGKATYKQTYREAFPLNVFALPTDWESQSYHKQQVSFTFLDWVSEKEKKSIQFDLVKDTKTIRSGGSFFGETISR